MLTILFLFFWFSYAPSPCVIFLSAVAAVLVAVDVVVAAVVVVAVDVVAAVDVAEVEVDVVDENCDPCCDFMHLI